MGSADNFELFTYVLQQLDQYNLAYVHLIDGLAFGVHGKCKLFQLYHARLNYNGPLMGNCGYTKETAEGAINTGCVDMIAFGRPYIANPDLVERFTNNWPLAADAPYPVWWDAHGAEGYSDFPAYSPN
jgi:2,4-dienoyl-CoA reductase-like NADH-dependent reductase (Old Yellow Enzyme family)